MNTNIYVRSVDELGRIVLPMEVRQTLDLMKKSEVRIWADAANRQIVLRKEIPTCIFCGGTGDLKELQDKAICCACQEKIALL